MDRLRAMQIFVQIADTGSLTAAADALHMSAPAVVRSLAALETTLGTRLLHRTTRRSSLSDEGREYYERCKRILADLEEADAALSSRRVEPRGRLRITAPVTYGRMFVAPVVNRFTERFSKVAVELLLLDRVVDLVEEGIDAAVRIGHLPDSTLVATRLGETRRVIAAAPSYLRNAGTPRRPEALLTHRCIHFLGLGVAGEWSFAGKPAVRVPITGFLHTNQIDVARDACVQGLGCGQFLGYQVEALFKSGALQRLLRSFEPEPLPIQWVHPHGRMLSANLRAFMDLAVPALRDAAPGV